MKKKKISKKEVIIRELKRDVRRNLEEVFKEHDRVQEGV